ncbi:MAG: SpoIIE family protein phosphatase [Cyclobacteriaceae bacterium]|nr:SpoIIE family protein phosphatase [Cyclobacteriaceae bacterium]MCH8516220.1 SpoIIE family protein phosphatase [Cyclobacteriaceae bacterium]
MINYPISFKSVLVACIIILFSFISEGFGQSVGEKKIAEAEAYESQENWARASGAYNEAAYYYWENRQEEQALTLFGKSLALNERVNNQRAIGIIRNNMGTILSDLGRYNEAVTEFEKALAIRRQQGDRAGQISVRINIGLAYQLAQNPKAGISAMEPALDLAKEMNDVALMKTCYSILSELHQQAGNQEKSFEYFNIFTSLEKKSQQEQISRTQQEVSSARSEAATVKKEVEKKSQALDSATLALMEAERVGRERAMEISLLNKENEIRDLAIKEQQARIKANNIITYFLVAIGLIIFFVAITFYFNFKKQRKTNELLQSRNKQIDFQKEKIKTKTKELEKLYDTIRDKNEKINSSIKYAQRIQVAAMPTEDTISKVVPESFVLFKPRDVVSGDFYWLKSLRQDNQGRVRKFVITAADCTGHGIPGAFMSLIGINQLENIVGDGVTESNKILTDLHLGIRKALKQDITDNRDGMDMALCTIDLDERKLQFSGAKNPLVMITGGEVLSIKGDKMPIGGRQKEAERVFEKHDIELNDDQVIYLFSDGYQDQFGGMEKRKFMVKNLRNFLLEIHQKPMEEQHRLLEDKFERWRGNLPQIDDVIIFGFRIKLR